MINPQSEKFLKSLEKLDDDQVPLAKTALMLAFVVQPDISLERYESHLIALCDETKLRYDALLQEGAEDNAGTKLAAMKHVLVDVHGYRGDSETYDDLQNASLIRVIERRKGLPIVLSILCIRVGLSMGWQVDALMIPGHVVCRLDDDGERLIFDPFEQCRVLQAPDLRALVKKVQGPNAELKAEYYEPASYRETLIRLQNNIKYRQIEMEDYEGALLTVDTMRMIDPEEYRLLLDAGVLYARVGQSLAAIDVLEDYIKLAPNDRNRYEAGLLLEDLKSTLN